MRLLLTPRWLLSHVFVIAMVVLMVSLGFWQLRRLDQRRDDNAIVRDAIAATPVVVDGAVARGEALVDYTAATVSGVYRLESEVLVANRTFDGQAGYWVATPLEIEGGPPVVVVRGWVPRLVVAGSDPRSIEPPSGRVTVTGLAFDSVGGGRVADVPTGATPQLSRMDITRFEETTGLDVADTWVRLEGQIPAQPDLPLAVPAPDLGEGPHLSYAFQWFFFSAGTVVVYALILRRQLDPQPAPPVF